MLEKAHESNTMADFRLEVCIDSVASAQIAEAGGAHRVELCDNLVEGGTTPSWGMIETVCRHTRLDVMVMVRPRGGDFLYDELEFETMAENVQHFRKLNIRGIVLGLLTADGHIDVPRTRQLVELAGPLEVTFHRAFDMAFEPIQALDDLLQTGIHRLLTSGQEATAYEGRALIRQLVERAGDKMSIMPGGGVNEENISDLIAQTGVTECHVSARHNIASGMKFTNPRVYMGTPGLPEYERKVTSEKRVRELLFAAKGTDTKPD